MQNASPARSRQRRATVGSGSRRTPSASSTSALPLRLEMARLPCLTTGTPAAHPADQHVAEEIVPDEQTIDAGEEGEQDAEVHWPAPFDAPGQERAERDIQGGGSEGVRTGEAVRGRLGNDRCPKIEIGPNA